MFRRFLVLVVTATLVATIVGCHHKPLDGLLLQMKADEITGYRADMVSRSVSSALVADGARWAEESVEGAVILTGLSIVTWDSADRLQIWSLSVSAVTSDGKYPFTTFASVRANQVFPYGDRAKMALALGKQVSEHFASQLKENARKKEAEAPMP